MIRDNILHSVHTIMATPNPGLDAVAANCSITSQRVWSKSARQKKESGLTAARISTPSLDGRCHMMRYLSIQSHALMALSLSSCRYRIQCWLLAYYCDSNILIESRWLRSCLAVKQPMCGFCSYPFQAPQTHKGDQP